ncbi:MAG: fatty acid--CoA ligase [Pseudonocardiaceae bacterium]
MKQTGNDNPWRAPHTLAASIARQAEQRPDSVALHCEGREVSYQQLHRESNRTAHALHAAGLTPGDRVAYLGKESEHYYEIVLGCAKSGAVLVPINWRLTPGEVDHILRDSDTRLLFVEREFTGIAQRIRPSLPTLGTIVALDSAQARATGFLGWKADQPDTDLDRIAEPADPVVQIYTSGTTGLPKGVVLPNHCFFTFGAAMVEHGLHWMDWRAEDISLISLPGFQIAGLSWAMQGLTAGMTNVIMRMFVSQEALELIDRLGITTTFVAPAMLQMLLAEPSAGPDSFRSLRKVVYGGSPISQTLLRQCLEVIGCEFLQIYASTETGNVAVCLPPTDHYPGSPLLGAAGKAYPGVQVKIIDGAGRMLPPGESGEICVRTPAHMLEYWRLPESTAQTLVDGWIHTGDAGHLNTDGYLFVGDRIKDMIIVAGQNVYPAEVEDALSRHPAVADVAVIGIPDERWGEAIHACVVLRPGQRATGRELMVSLNGRLAGYKVPTSYDFVEGLPRNPAGKVLRRTLRDPFWRHLDRQVN